MDQALDSRAEEILANCGHENDADKDQLIEEIINDEKMMAILTEMAWMYRSKPNAMHLEYRTATGFVRSGNALVSRMEELAEGIAESEQ